MKLSTLIQILQEKLEREGDKDVATETRCYIKLETYIDTGLNERTRVKSPKPFEGRVVNAT